MSDITTAEVAPKQIPTGESKKISEFSQKNPLEHLATFSQVKNKVLIVNPNIHSPFELTEGNPTPLGVFMQNMFAEKDSNSQTRQINLEILPGETRTALLARAVFGDNEGNLYRDVDLKGIGFLKVPGKRGKYESYFPTDVRPFPVRDRGSRSGLLDKEVAMYDYENSEDLAAAGVRVSRTITIINLEELIVDGQKMSIDEARRKKYIEKNFVPVIEVRAFGTRARVRDARFYHRERDPSASFLLEDAKKLVAQELGKDSITNDEYLEWFAQTLATNVGIIRRNGWYHHGLHEQNITLDCRIVDLDSLETHRVWHSTPFFDSDFEFAKGAIAMLYRTVARDSSFDYEDYVMISLRKKKLPEDLARYFDIYNKRYQEVLKK